MGFSPESYTIMTMCRLQKNKYIITLINKRKSLRLPCLVGIYFLKYYTKFIIVILFQFGLKIMIRTIFQKQLILIRVFSLLFLFLSTSILYAYNTNSAQELTTFEQIEKMRIGVLGASANKEILQNKAPNAKNFSFFNTNVDGVSAVISNKVDCYIDDEPVLRLFVNRNPGIKLAPLVIDSFDYGIALKKNNPLTSKISQVINDFRKKCNTIERFERRNL